jgi:hypothetical membrane protein
MNSGQRKEKSHMKRFQNISFIAAFLIVVCYLVFATLSYSRYPLPYSPIRNWLSDLGNVNLNPRGAIYYNMGIISTALLLMLFFLGLSRWKIENKRVQIIMLLLTQVFGFLGSFCMIMSAIFPINILAVHRIWSMSLYFMLATAFVFSVAAPRYHQIVPRWLLGVGLTTAVMVNLTSFLPNVYVLEWITVLLFLSYVYLVGIETKRV